MNRPYTVNKIKNVFNTLKNISSPLVKGGTKGGFEFGTDIIVAFPGETESDFRETLFLCKSIGFQKIHVFRFSPRANTKGLELFSLYPKIPAITQKLRSQLIHSVQLQ